MDLTGLYSFLENFIPSMRQFALLGFYGNQWGCDTEDKWHEITGARFIADATAGKQQKKPLSSFQKRAFKVSSLAKERIPFQAWKCCQEDVRDNGN